jgi:hypothetical protein
MVSSLMNQSLDFQISQCKECHFCKNVSKSIECFRCKSCSHCEYCTDSIDCHYCKDLHHCKKCSKCTDHSEWLEECVDCHGCFQLKGWKELKNYNSSIIIEYIKDKCEDEREFVLDIEKLIDYYPDSNVELFVFDDELIKEISKKDLVFSSLLPSNF